jgi:hypothetical protein
LGEAGFGLSEGGADSGLEALVELVAAVGEVELGEEVAEEVGGAAGAEIDGTLAAVAAIGEERGREFFPP